MKMNLKRKIAWLLSVAMLVSAFPFASALNSEHTSEDNPYPQTALVSYQGHGMYASVKRSLFNNILGVNSLDDTTNLSLYSDAGIYTNDENDYFLNVRGNTYLQVYPVNINLLDLEKMEEIFAIYNFSSEIQFDLRKASEAAINEGKAISNVTIYTPNLPTTTRSSMTTYYTYKNADMKDIVISYSNEVVRRRPIKTGRDTLKATKKMIAAEVVSGIKDLLGKTSYVACPALPYLQNGISLYQALIEDYNAVNFTADSGDFTDFSMTYDKYMKYTYVDQHDGKGFQHGATTMYVHFDEASFYVSAYIKHANGGGERISREIAATGFTGNKFTPNYMTPAKYAYGGSGSGYVYSESLQFSVEDQVFHP